MSGSRSSRVERSGGSGRSGRSGGSGRSGRSGGSARSARDPIAEHNRKMWDRLSEAGHTYTRADGRLPKTAAARRRLIDPRGRLHGVRLAGARVLALAAGGGWDAVAFAALGAETTLLDISERQLETVRRLARRERVAVRLEQGTMKDLSRFAAESFDIVWHCHSLVFVDDAARVLREIGRVLAPGGTYVTSTMHPTTLRLYRTYASGWHPRSSYFDDGPIPYEGEHDATWWFDEGKSVVAPTIEFGHRMETLVNAAVAGGMVVDGLWEWSPDAPNPNAPLGSDEHLESTFPAFVELRARKLPSPRAR